MPIYNTEELKKYCEENKIQLLQNYFNEKAVSRTIIEGKCLNENCNENFKKAFIRLIKSGGYCNVCTLKNRITKFKETNLEIYGFDNPRKNESIKEKCKTTCLEKYGVNHPLKNKIVQEKLKKTNLEKFGFQYASQNLDIKEKVKSTNLEKFGFQYASQNLDIKEKVKNTCLKKFGSENVFLNKEIMKKCKDTLFEKYGVRHPLQNPEISEKMFKSCHLLKDYTLPSKKVIQMQGYENFGMDELLFIEKIDENDIIISRKKVPEIWYKDKDGKQHRYFVDFYIPHQKRCIEIKSTWTLKKDNVFEKQQAMKDAGYQCEIWVFDDKGNKLECYK